MRLNSSWVFVGSGAVFAAFAAGCGDSVQPGEAPSAIIDSDRACPVYKCPPGTLARKADSPTDDGQVCRLRGAAVLDGWRIFHELDTDSANAPEGLRIIDVEDGNKQPLQLVVNGGQVTAVDSSGRKLDGDQLVDAFLYLEDTKDPTQQYYLHITAVDMMPYPIGSGVTYTYHFTYRNLRDGVDEVPLCTTPARDGWGALEGQAFLFGDDHYNEVQKTVDMHADTRFNIACAGTSFATMHLARHTTASSDASHTTTREQRQAMFKMLYGDYCGTGRSFTWNDYPVLYGHEYSTLHDYEVSDYEAIWNEYGAVCLDVPRLEGAADNLADRIEAECKTPLPRCTPKNRPRDISGWQKRGYVLSANGIYGGSCPLP
jgi:hypothetical protein